MWGAWDHLYAWDPQWRMPASAPMLKHQNHNACISKVVNNSLGKFWKKWRNVVIPLRCITGQLVTSIFLRGTLARLLLISVSIFWRVTRRQLFAQQLLIPSPRVAAHIAIVCCQKFCWHLRTSGACKAVSKFQYVLALDIVNIEC